MKDLHEIFEEIEKREVILRADATFHIHECVAKDRRIDELEIRETVLRSKITSHAKVSIVLAGRVEELEGALRTLVDACETYEPVSTATHQAIVDAEKVLDAPGP